MMRRLLPLLLLCCLGLPVLAAAKSNTVVLRPGETLYVRFEPNGKKIKLAGYSKEKDDKAQVVFSAKRDEKTLEVNMKVENRFPDELTYHLVIHSIKLDRETSLDTSPVVGNKLSFEVLPALTEEMFLTDFRLTR